MSEHETETVDQDVASRSAAGIVDDYLELDGGLLTIDHR